MHRISHRVLFAASAAVLFLVVLLLATQSTAPSTAQAGPFVQPQVHASMALQGTVDVLITLREPEVVPGLAPNSLAVRRAFASEKSDVLAGISASEFRTIREYDVLPILAGSLNAAGLAKLSKHPNVATVSIDVVGSIATEETLPIIHAPEVHANGITGEGVVVAVLDTGAEFDHPDLKDDILYEACFLRGDDCDDNPEHPGNDENSHGTNVAGIITSDGLVAPLGVAPDAKIAVYRIMNRNGFGSASNWIAALNDIIANHPEVNVINMSLQSGASCPSEALSLSIGTLRDMGVATFIASGNHGNKDEITIPGCVPEAISVGATYDGNFGEQEGWIDDCLDETTAPDQIACWSDSDDTLDLVAPGSRVTSTGLGGDTSTWQGTSQAAPHAAAVAALLFQAYPNLTVDELEARMKATGTLITDDLDDDDTATNRTTPRVDARVALLDPGEDYDNDGCTNGEELSSDPRFGGLRNPLNPWDFHDVNGDGVIALDDIVAVILGYGVAGGDPLLDRSPAPPDTDPWHQGPPDGKIDLASDILGITSQYGHSCAGAP